MTQPSRGMDHTLYPYSAIDRRPKLVWPNDARLAVTVLLHLEYWELEPPEDALRDPRFQGAFPTFFPDYMSFTAREYGNRVGIFRVLDALDRHDFRLTVPVNSAALERYPTLVRRLIDRDAEFVAHGSHANRMVTSRMDKDAQLRLIEESVTAIERATGQRPTGWSGPSFGEAWETAEMVAEFGLDYVMDWPNDDQPYRMTTTPPIISVPRQPEWDDVESLWLRKVPNDRYIELVESAYARLHEEGAVSGRYFSLSLHPWVAGQAHRIRYIEETLERIAARNEGVWYATAGEVALHAKAVLSDGPGETG